MTATRDNYKTITGRVYTLEEFSEDEKRVLGEVRELYKRTDSLEGFSVLWAKRLRELWGGQMLVGHGLYRICQDLEMRLGIDEGSVGEPDYRDVLHDMIAEKYGSFRDFCERHKIDSKNLGKIFAGKKEDVAETYNRVLGILGVSEEELEKRISI